MVSGPMGVSQRREFVVAVGIALALIALFAAGLAPGLSLDLRQTTSGLGLLVAGASAALSCWVRSRRSSGRRRRSWNLLTAAAAVAIAGNVWLSLDREYDPVRSPSAVSDVSIAIALLLSIAALLNFPSVRRRGVELLVISLDGLIVGAGVLVIASVLVYSELLDSTSGSGATRFTTLLIPVLDVVLVTVGLLIVLRSRGGDRTALALV